MNPQSNDAGKQVNVILDHIGTTGPDVVQSLGESRSRTYAYVIYFWKQFSALGIRL